jgi:phosphoglycerate dehydrogenase-like enzyme
MVSRMRPVRILVPATIDAVALGALPDDVELILADDGPLPAQAAEARMAILSGGLPRRLDEVLAATPALEVLQTVSAGVDWIGDRVPDGVTLCNASGVHDTPVAEWVVGAILTMTRKFPEFLALQARGEWDDKLNGFDGTQPGSPLWPITDLDGKHVLVLGHGSIGRAVEARLAPFGATVTGVARRERPGVHPLSEARALAGEADVVVVLLPLTEETDGFVDGAFLDAMRPGALLVNAGRGRHVVTADLVERLRAGRVLAALDVTDPEPLPQDHPLWKCPGLLVTPHIAGTTEQWLGRALAFAGDQIRRFAAGEPLANVRTEGY